MPIPSTVKLTVTDIFDNSVSETFANSITGLQSKNNFVEIYPMPASNFINVVLPESWSGELTAGMIYNSMGQAVQPINTMKSRVSVENLLPGLYILKAVSPNGSLTKTFIRE